MITIALDTASPRGEVALLRDGQLLGAHSFPRLAGDDGLFAALARLGRAHPQMLGAVELIGVGLGPGSFTGIRAGLAAAKGLALPRHVPITGVNTFDALALTAQPRMPADAARLCVLCDARRDEIYCAFYDRDGARPGDVQIRPLESMVDMIHDPVWFVSWEIERYAEPLRSLLGGFALLAPTLYPGAAAVGQLAERRFFARARQGDPSLEPCYLRPLQYRTIASAPPTTLD